MDSNKHKNAEKTDSTLDDYLKIVQVGNEVVSLSHEWQRPGDYFKKFSIYDDTYESIPSIGGTTLI